MNGCSTAYIVGKIVYTTPTG